MVKSRLCRVVCRYFNPSPFIPVNSWAWAMTHVRTSLAPRCRLRHWSVFATKPRLTAGLGQATSEASGRLTRLRGEHQDVHRHWALRGHQETSGHVYIQTLSAGFQQISVRGKRYSHRMRSAASSCVLERQYGRNPDASRFTAISFTALPSKCAARHMRSRSRFL